MGFYDDVGEDAEEETSVRRVDAAGATQSAAAQLELSQQRSPGGTVLVRMGRLAGRLEAAERPVQDAFHLLALDRIVRRVLAAARIDCTTVLPTILGGVPAPVGANGEIIEARTLLHAFIAPLAFRACGAKQIASRFIKVLRIDQDRTSDWDPSRESQRIQQAIASAEAYWKNAFASADPLFAITDFAAAYGAELNLLPFDHLPDSEWATDRDVLVESFRPVRPLPPQLERIRAASPDGLLLTIFDVAAAIALSDRAGTPILSGLIRYELFTRDLHYPADVRAVYTSLASTVGLAERDLEMVRTWRASPPCAHGRLPLMLCAALSCLGAARASSLERLLGSSWQGLRGPLELLTRSGSVYRSADGIWCWRRSSECTGNLPESEGQSFSA